MQAVYRFQPLDAGVAEQVSHLFILFQQTHQILLVLWLLLLLDSRRRSIVRPNGGHQQFRIFVDIGHRRVLFIGSQQLRQVQLHYRRIQCVHVDGRCEQQRRSNCFLGCFRVGRQFLAHQTRACRHVQHLLGEYPRLFRRTPKAPDAERFRLFHFGPAEPIELRR